MHSIPAYVMVAALGVFFAHWMSRAPELRRTRLFHLLVLPGLMVLAFSMMGEPGERPDLGGGLALIGIVVFAAFILAPNLAFYLGAGLSNLLDPTDWTPAEEELALRPINQLVVKEQYNEALARLDELLKRHKPTFEALLIKANLLHHLGSVDETAATLLKAVGLSHTTAQQLSVMELLALLETQLPSPRKPLTPGTRRVEIHHELVLFPITANDAQAHHVIPPGTYEVRETFHRHHRWWKLAEEDWGNAEMCWEAVREIPRPEVAPTKIGFLSRMSGSIAIAIHGKPRHQTVAESRTLLREANQLIKRGDWLAAIPLLQKASACDPDCYEIAYRWAQAAYQMQDRAAAASVVDQVRQQSRWTEDEKHMLRELQRPTPRGAKSSVL